MSGGTVPAISKGLSRCLRCQTRQLSELRPMRPIHKSYTRWTSSFTKSSSTAGYYPPPSELKESSYVHLKNRAIIRLYGPDVLDFLNGLLPAKLQSPLKNDSAPIFTTFLSAKGRILFETFVYPPKASDPESSWYIETDSESLSALFSHLKKHKLRSKFKLEKIAGNDLGVYYLWPGHNAPDAEALDVGGQDPRPLMGTRFLSGANISSSILSKLQETGSALSLEDYKIHRILCGHAEGPNEMIPTSALPQESNLDFSEGIDFHKGCYLGQELTIRTHHTGVVRKRILPCQICPGDQALPKDQLTPLFNNSISVYQPPKEANIAKKNAKGRSGRSTGKWLGGVGNVGLALCRLEMMTDIQLTAEGTNFDPEGEFTIVWEEGEVDTEGKTALREIKLKPFIPQWVRDNIQARIQARSDRSKKRKQEEDDADEDVD